MPRYCIPAIALALAITAAISSTFVSQAQDTPVIMKAVEALANDKVEIPEARDKHEWIENKDIEYALKLAKKENRPVFATIRCLPCKQCSWFESAVMKPAPELEAKLKQFICLRVTTMRDVDERIYRFEKYQDMDCSWWGYFFDPDGRIYGVYGGIDIESDKSCISVKGLISAMDRVLKCHYHPDRESWNLFGDAPKTRGKAETPLKHDGWKHWAKNNQRADKILSDKQECLHCHEVAEVVRQPRFDKKDFDKQTDFYVWPYPQNIGLELDIDDSLKVRDVTSGGAAYQAGMAKGDRIEAANGQLIFSNTDLRRVLNELAWGDCKLTLQTRDANGEAAYVTVNLKEGWRKYDLGWRKSVAEANIGAHPGFPWPLQGDRQAAGVEADKLCIKPYMPKGPVGNAGDAGLKANDLIIAVDGESPNLVGRAFLAWFRMKYEPGDEITLTVVNNGKKRELKYKVGRHMDD
ncbi:MAG: thioredoxin family protein [Planctomycetes bacterium]|nr:thioredoxin family protein [Planctomycetota bacterium]